MSCNQINAMKNVLPILATSGFVLMISAIGCSLTDIEPERVVYPGNIRYEMASPYADARVDIAGHTVSLPREFQRFAEDEVELYEGIVEVQVGAPFDVIVYTFGGPDCHRPEESEVEVGASHAVISVFDSLPPDETSCSLMLMLHSRTDTIAFSEPGEAEVVVRGNTFGSDRHPYELRFPVLVKE
jgi:hypothetical protein